MTPEFEQQLREDWLEASRDSALHEAMARRVDELLVRQLGKSPPKDDELAAQWWRFRRHVLRARLRPDEAGALLTDLVSGPLRAEATRYLRAEIDRWQTFGELAGRPQEADQERVEVAAGAGSWVPARLLVPWPARSRAALPPGWRMALAVAAVVAWGVTWLMFGGLEALLSGRSAEAVGELPPTTRVVTQDVLAATAFRPALIKIPARTFQMGSPKDEDGRHDDEQLHFVKLTQPYYLGRTEVTQAQYETLMGTNPSEAEYEGVSLVGPELPVQNVSWIDAARFCNRLSEREGLTPAYEIRGDSVTWNRAATSYRLPTEAEWEAAARAGSTARWAGAGPEGSACDVGNVADRSAKVKFDSWTAADCDDGVVGLAPVARYPANDAGLHDMTGNVFEWVWDGYEADYPLAPDASRAVEDPAVNEGSQRVNRGGSWFSYPRDTRVANRNRWEPSERWIFLGFRVARSAPSPSDP